MRVFLFPLSCGLAMALAMAARAQPAAAPVATATDDATARQIDAWLADGADEAGPDAAVADGSGPQRDRGIHGQAEVAFGSNGYRAARMVAVMPVGEDGALGVAVADESFGGGRRGPRAENRSLALSLRLGSDGTAVEPCDLRHTGVRLAADLREDQRCGRGPDGLAAATP